MMNNQRILVVGDFDADGATSCALAVLGLQALGAKQVEYLVPNRFEYGYGLTPEIVEVALEQSPDLLVTVDNGISSIAGVVTAGDAGVPVLITDHHLPGSELPDAKVIVNPNLSTGQGIGQNLAGVGVLFYVLLALRTRLREHNWFLEQGISEPNLAGFLDLVALGTVADVVPLDHINRILVHQGIRRIRAGHCRPGIKSLLKVAGRNMRQHVAADLGFAIGPRLNAAGRLKDMSLGIETMITDSTQQADQGAAQLDLLNRQRREIEEDMRLQATAHLESLQLQDETDLPFGLCIHNHAWHQGVIGILASRIKERYHRPVIAFAAAEDGWIKGSARSVPGLHIKDVLDHIAAKNRGVIHSDGELVPGQINLEVAQLLRDAGPWGQHFPEPVFDGRFTLVNCRVVGEKHLKLVLAMENSDQIVDAIAFNQADRMPTGNQQDLMAAYRLDINEFRGNRSVQMIIQHLEWL